MQHAAAVSAHRLDWSPPAVITMSAPSSSASPRRNSRLRVLLPPTLCQTGRPALCRVLSCPASSPSRCSLCSGVGHMPNVTLGNAAKYCIHPAHSKMSASHRYLVTFSFYQSISLCTFCLDFRYLPNKKNRSLILCIAGLHRVFVVVAQNDLLTRLRLESSFSPS